MRKILFVAVSVLGIAQVQAADIYSNNVNKAAPAPFVVSPWDGPYIGGNAGWASTRFNASGTAAPPATETFTGGVFGGQVGFNKTWGTFLLGLEADGQTGVNGTDSLGTRSDIPWFATARLRAGFLLNPQLLVYGTGGGAYGPIQLSTVLPTSTHAAGVGWAAGGGLEWMFVPGWSVSAEYLHLDLGNISASVGRGHTTIAVDADVVRGKLNFHF